MVRTSLVLVPGWDWPVGARRQGKGGELLGPGALAARPQPAPVQDVQDSRYSGSLVRRMSLVHQVPGQGSWVAVPEDSPDARLLALIWHLGHLGTWTLLSLHESIRE